jgi:hypothetical protein
MINRHFQVDARRTDAMHAEPIAALDALKLASLAVTRDTLRCAVLLRASPGCTSMYTRSAE